MACQLSHACHALPCLPQAASLPNWLLKAWGCFMPPLDIPVPAPGTTFSPVIPPSLFYCPLPACWQRDTFFAFHAWLI